MIKVKPFKGITYNSEKIDDFSKVLTPPYDVIDPELQKKLYDAHPNNFVKIDYGLKFPDDNESRNVYTRSKESFLRWLEEEIFRKDNKDCFYILRQDFQIEGRVYSRLGFYGLFELTNFSKDTIMPHEKTQSGPKEDRYRLTKICKAYFSAVFSIYKDEKKTVERFFHENAFGTPYFTYTDYQDVKNILYKSYDKEVNKAISDMMSDKRLYIADGHHRYETALRIKSEFPDNENAKYTLMYFSNMLDDGLIVLPTHRLLNEISYNENDLKNFLEKYFNKVEFKHNNLKEAIVQQRSLKNSHTFIMITKNNLMLLSLKNMEAIQDYFPTSMPKVLTELDVNILFYTIIKGFFGITEEDIKNQNKISYTKDAEDAVEKVLSETAKIGLLLNPTELDALEKAAELNKTMPQKSTYFYPKIPSGAVIYNFL